MIHTGLVSVPFRKLCPAEIIALVKQAGLKDIEWGGDLHGPHGDFRRAREARELTQESGPRVAACGSCYRVGQNKGAGLASRALAGASLEFHGGTLADANGPAGKPMVEVDHPDVFIDWPPHNGEAPEDRFASLEFARGEEPAEFLRAAATPKAWLPESS